MFMPLYIYVTLGCIIVLIDIYAIIIGRKLDVAKKNNKGGDYKFAQATFRLTVASAAIYHILLVMVIVNYVVFNHLIEL
jgi:hypothetical protein